MIVDRDTQTAFHEAGHAVVARLLGMRFANDEHPFAISIDENEAMTHISKRSIDRAYTIDLVSWALAGGIAQYRLSGLADGLVSDAHGIYGLFEQPPEEPSLDMVEVVIAVVKGSEKPERVIESLRPDLLGFLKSKPIDVTTIFSASFVTRRLVFAYWEQITLLANHLMIVRRMASQELTAFLKLYGVVPEKKIARRLARANKLRFLIKVFWSETALADPQYNDPRPDDPRLVELMRHHGFVPVPGPNEKGRRQFIELRYKKL